MFPNHLRPFWVIVPVAVIIKMKRMDIANCMGFIADVDLSAKTTIVNGE
jgi:hypothetical protein